MKKILELFSRFSKSYFFIFSLAIPFVVFLIFTYLNREDRDIASGFVTALSVAFAFICFSIFEGGRMQVKDVFIPILTALIFTIFSIFLFPVESVIKKVYFLSPQKNVNTIISISNDFYNDDKFPPNGILYMEESSKCAIQEIKKEDRYLDLAEMEFFIWLNRKYMDHWDIDSEFGGFFLNSWKKDGAEKVVEEINFNDLEQMIKGNSYLRRDCFPFGFKLPKNSTFKVLSRNIHERIFLISNDYIDFKIDIHRTGNEWAPPCFVKEKDDPYSFMNMVAVFEFKYKKWYRGTIQTKKQKDWANEIMNDFYNDFDISKYRNDLVDVLCKNK